MFYSIFPCALSILPCQSRFTVMSTFFFRFSSGSWTTVTSAGWTVILFSTGAGWTSFVILFSIGVGSTLIVFWFITSDGWMTGAKVTDGCPGSGICAVMEMGDMVILTFGAGICTGSACATMIARSMVSASALIASVLSGTG